MTDGQKWSISYTDVFNKKTVESFDSKGEAQSRYEALIPRTYGDLGDLVSVSAPIRSATKVSESVSPEMNWGDFDNVVKQVLLREGDISKVRGSTYRSAPIIGGSSVHICTLDDDTPLFTIWPDYSNDSRGHVYVYNNNLDPAIFNKACSRIRELCWKVEKALSGNYDYPLTFHPFASREEMNKYFIDLNDLEEDCGGASAASLGAVPTGVVGRKVPSKRSEAKNPYYGYGKDDAIDKGDNDFMWQVAYNWFEERLPEKFKQDADRAVTEVIDSDMRAYEEIVTMDDYYDYLETYGPAVIKEITSDFAESKKNEGWDFGWFDKQTMIDDCVADYERSGNTLDKRYGDWACFYHNQDGRPFVVYFKTAKDGGQWGVKEIESCMGPYETNIQAAKWLKPRLEEWTSKDPKNAEKIQDYEWEWIEKCLGKEASNKAKKDVVKSLVEGDRIKLIDTVADGAVVEFVRMLTPSKMLVKHNGREMGCKTSFIDHKIEKPTEAVFDDDELERTGDQAPYRSMYAKDRKALQDALKVAQKYSPDAKIDPKKQKIVYNSPYGEVTIYTETFTGLGGSSDIQTNYEVSFIMYGHQHTTCDTLDALDIVLKGISAGISKHPGDSWDDFVRNVKRATRKPRAKRSEARGGGADLASVYGSGDIVTHESSADGFYVDDHDPMGWAILNNDVDTMKELFAGTAPTPDKPWLYAGWDEYTDAPADKDGSYPYRYSWDSERDLNFVEDWKRVVGETNNEEALNLLLEHDPDFIPTAIDFYNAFLAGYDKKLLRKLLDNIRAVWDKDDINDSYLNYEDFGETPYENLIEFLGE